MFVCEVKATLPQEFKVDTDNGTFEGFCAGYGNVDQGGDRLLFGSGAHIAKANPTTPIYFGHGWMYNERPLGKSLHFEERPQGLFTKGQIFDTPAGIETLTGMRQGVISTMSIGWKPVEKKMVRDTDGQMVREVSKWDLKEYSVLPTGMSMNPEALITQVKSGRLVVATDAVKLARINGEVSDQGKREALGAALEAAYSEEYTWVVDFSSDRVVYEVGDECFQMAYAMGADGTCTLTGDPVPVERQVTYVPTGKSALPSKVDVTDGGNRKDYAELRGFFEKSDPVALLLDEATFLHTLAEDLKAEGREEDVRSALSELDAAALLLKGMCAVQDIEIPEGGDIISLIRQTTQNIHEATTRLKPAS